MLEVPFKKAQLAPYNLSYTFEIMFRTYLWKPMQTTSGLGTIPSQVHQT